ncbi:hypothetical protein KPSA1B_101353 [Pseudomonas syringae pv. actinidiae]|nr:hypothetical protein KPSA1B_101353 [Pseudomonas syringae pv. actinidiae]
MPEALWFGDCAGSCLSATLSNPTAGCGKPHVRWCGRGIGLVPLPRPDQVRISIDQLAIISFHHHCASVLGAHSLYEPGALRARERLSCSGLLWERTCSRKLCFERQPPCECTPIPANKCLLRQHCPSQQIHKSSTPIHHAWPAICMTASRYPRRVPCHTPILGRCGRPLA